MNALRVSFLLATDALMVVLLAALVAGCGGAPARYRNGDFVSNLASGESVSRERPTPRSVEHARQAGLDSQAAAATRVAG